MLSSSRLCLWSSFKVAGGASRACEAALTFCSAAPGQPWVPPTLPPLMEPEHHEHARAFIWLTLLSYEQTISSAVSKS